MARKSKHSAKTEEEKFHIKNRLSVLLRRGLSRNKAFEVLKEEGFKLSVATAYKYSDELKTEWIEARNESYDQHIANQLAKLDLIEERLWNMLDASSVERIKDVIEYRLNDTSDDSPELRTEIHSVGRKSDTTDINPKVGQNLKKYSARQTVLNSYGDIEIIKEIKEVWNKRNAILGIHTETTLNVQNNFNQNNISQNVQPISDKFFGSFIIQEDVRKLEE